jgi:uncharacterized protein (DUF58 family)
MSKFNSKGRQINPPLFMILFVIILAMVAGVYLLLSRPAGRIEFSSISLEKSEISVNEKTSLILKVKNNSEKDYQSVLVQIATKSSYVDMYYPSSAVTTESGEHRLTLSLGLVRAKEESRSYAIDLTGKELPSGTLLVEVEVYARIIADSEKTDERTFVLQIKSS